jgi:hypothetical protein
MFGEPQKMVKKMGFGSANLEKKQFPVALPMHY